MGHWKCTICGYEYHAKEAYGTCPSCNNTCAFIDMSTDCRTNPDFCKISEDE